MQLEEAKQEDIIYIFNKLKDKFSIELLDNQKIQGCSEIGKMIFYIDEGLFVFSYEYKTKSKFFKKEKLRTTHRHPYNKFDAIEFIERFMNNDYKFFNIKR